jgi:SET domain-containing protein
MPQKPFRIARSPTGLGLFATERIAKGALIVEYSGPRIPTKQARKREQTRGNKYMFEIDARRTIDGSGRDNLARYANHSCRPNAEAELVRGRMMLRAIKNIRAGEEITYDYGEDYVALFFTRNGCKCAACSAKRRKRGAPAKLTPIMRGRVSAPEARGWVGAFSRAAAARAP